MTTADSHLDAETLAAWTDGGLSGDELRMVQTHVADCARCQALVGAMARTEAGVEADLQVRAVSQRAPRRWLAWVVPLTAAATAVLIWAIVPRTTTPPQPAATEAARAGSPAVSQPEVVVSPEVIPEKEEAPVEKKAAPPAPPPPAETRDQLAERVTVAPPQETRKEVAQAAPSANIATFAAPRMQDLCGASWTGPAPAVTTPLTAGTSPAPNVCWIVGRLGVVLLTTDGRTWRGITFPVITDLSSVTATDARNATVVTADDRRFTTTDGGMTWK